MNALICLSATNCLSLLIATVIFLSFIELGMDEVEI